jgi:ADP-ribose pyrophosphatase YjhB (NUDIX family)
VKPRAAAVIVRDDHLLVIHRRKHGTEYFTLPGGGVEAGESIEQACAREIEEETGLRAVVGERLLTLANDGRTEHYFAADAPTGDVQLGGEEAEIDSPTNQYTLMWLPLAELAATDLKPAAAKAMILAAAGGDGVSRAW